jgi:DNA invertase Pin-like site-specific DNA recombinase
MVKKHNKVVGYLRVSTLDQDLEKNKADILKLVNEKQIGKIQFIEEKVSGKIHWKDRKIGQIIEELDKGIVLWSVSYLDWGVVCWSVWRFYQLRRKRRLRFLQ